MTAPDGGELPKCRLCGLKPREHDGWATHNRGDADDPCPLYGQSLMVDEWRTLHAPALTVERAVGIVEDEWMACATTSARDRIIAALRKEGGARNGDFNAKS